MPDLLQQLSERFAAALTAAFGDAGAGADPLLKPAGNPRFGDFQANCAMPLAKQLGQNPRQVATALVEKLDLQDLAEKVEIAGPGFLNITLRADAVASAVTLALTDPRLGVPPSAPQTVVIDYSGPNVAKEMHVGHLRSTIIGDALARVLEFLGHRVIRQNHLGDWGTQFGMLIEHLVEIGFDPSHPHPISDLNALYQESKRKDDSNPDFAQRARQRVVLLQRGDAPTRALWQALIHASTAHFNEAYHRLGVLLSDQDIRAESAYNDDLPGVIAALREAGLLRESQGAQVVFPAGFADADGNPLPMIVQKSDGGFLYATTDLAAARYRIQQLAADRLVYVTDSRQTDHFRMVFWALRTANWAPEAVRLDHVPFGTVLGRDRKPFKTREGGTVKLIDLINEAEARAQAVIDAREAELTAEERQQVAHAVGIGALKYADLSSDRIKDYVFDWDRMLAMEGNTAPYLQNAYVRVQSIFRKGSIDGAALAGDGQTLTLTEPAEKTLALRLLQLPTVVASVAETLEPHRLCGYLYEVAAAYHQFYEQCPVLTASDDTARRTRLKLCRLTAQVLKQGLALLGIEVVERM